MKKKPQQMQENPESKSGRGGLIVVCGPPFSGKSLIGTRLAECLPNAVKLEAEDNILRAGEVWYPDDRSREPVHKPQGKLLETASDIWGTCEIGRTPIVILVARFATPSARRRAYKLARSKNVFFLLIQAHSTNMPVMRRISKLLLPRGQASKRIEQITKAVKAYQAISSGESEQYPCVRLKGDLSALDNLFAEIVSKWLV